MPRFDVEKFKEHDECTKGDERGVIVLCTNGKTGERFPMVWILSGSRKNLREYPWRGWTVDLDWSKTGRKDRCKECEREFRIPSLRGPIRQRFCRQCDRQLNQTTRQDEPSSASKRAQWARKHEPARSPDAE